MLKATMTPQDLHRRSGEDRLLTSPEMLEVAEAWNADREKIRYLESLLLRQVSLFPNVPPVTVHHTHTSYGPIDFSKPAC